MNANEKQIPARLAAVLARAQAVRISLPNLCLAANLPLSAPSTIYRWRSGASSPTLGKYEHFLAALEMALAREEQRLRASLIAAE